MGKASCDRFGPYRRVIEELSYPYLELSYRILVTRLLPLVSRVLSDTLSYML